MKKRRAFSYIRMSTEIQLQGHSLERQVGEAKRYAKEMEFELVEDLHDIGLSAHDGTNVAKGKLGEFLKALENGEIEKDCILLVESFDRLSRKNPMQAFRQFSEILDHGIEIHTISDRQVYTSASVNQNPGQLFSSIGYMLRAYSESEEKSKRLKKRWQSNRNNLDNRILTSRCPAWLKPNADKTSFEEIPERVEIIREIFDLCIERGMGAYSIASYLNKNVAKYPRFTIPMKRNRDVNGQHKTGWQKSYILKILRNPAVHGEFQAHEKIDGKRKAVGGIRPNYFPAIIQKNRFLLAQSRLTGRSIRGGGRKGEDFKNIFTKLIVCEGCGSTVIFQDKGASPKGGLYLRCSNAVSKHKCNQGAWRYQDFEEAFFNFVTDVEFAAALRKGNDDSRRKKLIDQTQANAEEIKQKRQRIEGLFHFENGLDKNAITMLQEIIARESTELSNLEATQREITKELNDIQARSSRKAHDEIIKSIEAAQKASTSTERTVIRRVIHNQICAVVEKITIDGLTAKDSHDRRNFTVFFKNGEMQTIYPHRKLEYSLISLETDFETGQTVMGVIKNGAVNSIKLKHIGANNSDISPDKKTFKRGKK